MTGIGLRSQAAAVKDLLEGEGLTVYDAIAPDNASGRYAVIYTGRRYGGARRLDSRSLTRPYRLSIVVVGNTLAEARWVEEKVEATLTGLRVVIDDVVCTPAAFESSRPVERDPDNPKVYSGTTVWTYTTNPVVVPPLTGLDQLDGINDPWRWGSNMGGWVSPAYMVHWEIGDSAPMTPWTPPGPQMDVYVGSGAVPYEAAQQLGYYSGWASVQPAENSGNGIGFVVQYETDFAHTVCPDPSFDILTVIGDAALLSYYPWPS